jgi:4-amino-4-deoxy-L-arabinose transferase-like glycosyltransferase
MKALVIILGLTIFIRFFNISSLPAGLYWDELDTGYQAYSLLQTGRDYFGNLFPAHLQAFADYRSGLYMYLAVPLVKIFGLSPLSVRGVSSVWSVITVLLSYIFAARILRLGRNSWILPAVMSLAPWGLIQGRIAAESQLLVPLLFLGLISLYTTRYSLFALSFGLCLWAYPTAKLFIPVFILILFIVYKPNLKKMILPALLFLAIGFLPIYETFTKPIGRRFAELSIFSDPTVKKQVETNRQISYLSSGAVYQPGLQPGLIDKIIYNKYTLLGQKLITNYFTPLSTGFLFIKGDPNLRHNLNLVNTGQFYLIDLLPFVLGLVYVLSNLRAISHKLLASWLFLAPLPAIFTSDGSTHAPRLIFMFPVIAIIISLGLHRLFRSKLAAAGYVSIFCLTIFITFQYLFTTYRAVSAEAFNHGFLAAVTEATSRKGEYRKVILDMYNESALMAYLFDSKYPPAEFQKSFPLEAETIFNGVEGYKFENIIILYPGTRDWNKIQLPGKNLIFARSTQPNATKIPGAEFITNPDSSPAIVKFTQNN